MAPMARLLAVGVALAAAGEAPPGACAADGTCAARRPPAARDSALLQKAHDVSSKAMSGSWPWGHGPKPSLTSDCAARLNMHEPRHSGCIVVRKNKALLVWVPYGNAPGWDLPGGHLHEGESACETAERETCEETGFKVQAVKQLSWNVFQCEIVAERACRNPVDEGFLRKNWVSFWQLDQLQYRGNTWGDKQGLLRGALSPSLLSLVPHKEDPQALLQQKQRRATGITSDCANRLNMHDQRNAACIVTSGDLALLVWVPYGSRPGWDLPGGCMHSGEAACETAEREVCEETGYQVRAVKQLSWNVFECEIVAANVCTNAVDEGFLNRKWATSSELPHLQYRGDTWGDKPGLLESQLGGGAAPAPGWQDVCGCKMCHGEGFSTTRGQCGTGHDTGRSEACACLQRRGGAMVDDCGCKSCEGEGWSTTRGRCASGSDTAPEEACECQRWGRSSSLAQVAA